MSLSEQQIYLALQQIFNDVFRRQDITLTPALSAADVPGWDSFRYVSLLVAVEQRFHIALDGEEADNMKNIGDLVRTIQLLSVARGPTN